MLSMRPRSKQLRDRRHKFQQSKSLSLSESMEAWDTTMPNITATKGSFKHFAQTVARFQALRSRRNTSDDLLGMAARQNRAAPPKFQRMNSVMNFGIKEDLGINSSPPPVNKNMGSGSPSSSSTSLNKSPAMKPFIPPQPPLQPKLNNQALPGLDKRVWKKLPINYFQFVFIGIALFVAAVILLYTPSKLAKSRHSQQFQNGRASSTSGWRNPYVADFKSLTDNVICQIEQFTANEITQEIFSQLLEGNVPKLLVPNHGVTAWSSSANLWHFESMVRNFGGMRVHYEEYTANRGSLSGKMLLEEAMGRFKTSQDNLETSNIKTYGNFGKHLHFSSFISSSQKINQIELSVGETWHKDYLTVESVTAIVQGARRWLFYKGLKEDIQDITRKWFEEKYLDLGKNRNIQECIQHTGDLLYVPSGYIALYVDVGDTVAFSVAL